MKLYRFWCNAILSDIFFKWFRGVTLQCCQSLNFYHFWSFLGVFSIFGVFNSFQMLDIYKYSRLFISKFWAFSKFSRFVIFTCIENILLNCHLWIFYHFPHFAIFFSTFLSFSCQFCYYSPVVAGFYYLSMILHNSHNFCCISRNLSFRADNFGAFRDFLTFSINSR